MRRAPATADMHDAPPTGAAKASGTGGGGPAGGSTGVRTSSGGGAANQTWSQRPQRTTLPRAPIAWAETRNRAEQLRQASIILFGLLRLAGL